MVGEWESGTRDRENRRERDEKSLSFLSISCSLTSLKFWNIVREHLIEVLSYTRKVSFNLPSTKTLLRSKETSKNFKGKVFKEWGLMLNTWTLPCRADKSERSCVFVDGKRDTTSWVEAAAGSGSLSWRAAGLASGWSSCGLGSRLCRDRGTRRWESVGRPWRRRGLAGGEAAATSTTPTVACPAPLGASARAPPRTCPSPAPQPSSTGPSPRRWSRATCPSRAGLSASC